MKTQKQINKKEAQRASIIFILIGALICFPLLLIIRLGGLGSFDNNLAFIIVGAVIGAIAGGITGLIIFLIRKKRTKNRKFRVHVIPARVLNENPDVIKFVNPSKLYKGPRRHHNFSEQFIEAIRYLHKTFYEVSPSSLSEWLEDFDRDAHPEKELTIWFHMAEVYNKAIEKFPDNLTLKKEIFHVILLYSMGSEEYVFSQIKPKYLSKQDIKFIMKLYNAA